MILLKISLHFACSDNLRLHIYYSLHDFLILPINALRLSLLGHVIE